MMTEMPEKTTNPENGRKASIRSAINEQTTHPTSYFETLTHYFKGNIGPGLFAMGDAFKNGGLIVATVLTLSIALMTLHCQYMLMNCSKKIRDLNNRKDLPDFAETVEQIINIGPKKIRPFSTAMGTAVNIFTCVTQLGFCCIYFVFISTNFMQIFDHYGVNINVHLIRTIIFIPILLPSLLTKLKFLAPVSGVANFCMITGLFVTLYFTIKDGLPNPSERNYYNSPSKLALYFGTAIFAFEGIAMVLPLKSSMKNQEDFEKPCGVLNVGIVIVTTFLLLSGFFGYLKWGEDVAGSLTLNLDVNTVLGQYVKIAVSISVLLGYPLQFFIAIQIMWPAIQQIFSCYKNPFGGELVFRFLMALLTFAIAQLVPNLGLFISLVGAFCSTGLALVFPPIIDLIFKANQPKGLSVFACVKNLIILMIALLGFCTGSYESISEIIKEFS